MVLEKEKNAKTIIENDTLIGYDIDKKTAKKYKPRMKINGDKGEFGFYIGVWDDFRLLSKYDSKKVTVMLVNNSDGKTDVKIKISKEEFIYTYLPFIVQEFGEPNTFKDFSMCENTDEFMKELNKGNILEGMRKEEEK